MKWNKKTLLSLMLALIMSMAFAMTACGSDQEEDEEVAVDPGTINLMDNPDATKAGDPALAKKAKKLNKDPSNFYGTWIPKSSDAENLYGNLEITINEDGTFDANITDIDLHGTWHKINGGIEYNNELISGKVFYGPTCIMTFEEFSDDEESDEPIEVVLVKKE